MNWRLIPSLGIVFMVCVLSLLGCGGGASAPTLTMQPYFAGSQGAMYLDSAAQMYVHPLGSVCQSFTNDVTLGPANNSGGYTWSPPCNTVGALVFRQPSSNCPASNVSGLWQYNADEYSTPSPGTYTFPCGQPNHLFVITPGALYQNTNVLVSMLLAPPGTFSQQSGMPSAYFYDDEGNIAGQSDVATVASDGSSVSFYSGSFDWDTPGVYAAVVYNQGGTYVAGAGTTTVLGGSPPTGGGGDPTCNDCNSN